MEIVAGKALKFRTRHGERIRDVIPKSHVLRSNGEVEELLVHWGMEEALVLRNMQIKGVPSPILRHYEWPGVFPPFEHQKETASFLTLHKRAFCFSEQGTGKSAAVAWATDYLMRIGMIRRVLIVCPVSVMDAAWRADLFRTAMHRRVEIAHGTVKKRVEVIQSDAEYVIINYDGLHTVADHLKRGGFDLVVCDEGNAIKNVKTRRWKSLREVVGADKWLWILTGTPAAQSPVDAYGLAKLVNPDGVPKYVSAFRDLTMMRLTQFKWTPRLEAKRIVHEALQPAIRFTKEQCLDLPEMVYIDREVEMTAMQKKGYDELRKRMVLMIEDDEAVGAVNAGVLMNKLLQLASGAVLTEKGNVAVFDISNRYDVLKEIIEGTENKVIVFIHYRAAIDLLREYLRKDGYTVGVIDGSVSATERASLISAFQTQPDPKILLIQPQAAAHGVTLTAADTIVWWAPIPSVEMYLQGNARMHRAGQTKSTSVFHLYGSPVERRIYQSLRNNKDVHELTVEMFE